MNNELSQWLQDFAMSNDADFDSDQVQMLNFIAAEIRTLTKERDSARWEVCELSSNGSIDGANREAENREWNYLIDR